MIDFNSKKGFICDMDGVIYHGNRILPGVREFIDWLHTEKKEYLFLTNNSGHTPRELQQKLARMGLEVSEDHFYTSALATADFLSRILNSSCTKGTAFHLLNHIIRNRGAECSATVDLFEFDLLSGEAIFFKCGAAPSYVKRGGSLFRVRSETAPIGLMKSIDAERIRVEIKSGDYVVMLSDGVSQTLDDAVWLLEILNKEAKRDVKEYAEYILSEAKKHTKGFDDMSVSVARVFAA